MNERIKDLARQATQEFSPAFERDKWEEKFAELILIEVTDILATYRLKVTFHDGIEYNCQHPIYAIQKHFGVE